MTQAAPAAEAITSSAAARELLRRRRGRASLVGYSSAIEIPGKPVDGQDPEAWLFEPVETAPAAHHLLLMRTMERAAMTPYGRFMFFLPPGAAKSTYGSVVGPTYFMGKYPGTKIILASYASPIARKHGRRARQIARSPAYAALWGASLSHETSAAEEWAISNGSEYMAAGILSGLGGNRADGALLDDPIKGREQADSKTIREKTWEAYTDDFSTRLKPRAWMGIITTRWHEDDVAGRLLPKGYEGQSGLVECKDGRMWDIVNLPAECERTDDPLGRRVGEMLWPQWFDESHWAPFRKQSRTWASLFQQRPRPDEGGVFKEAWCRERYGEVPHQARRVVHSWDTAQKPEEINDYTVGSVWHSGPGIPGHYLREVFRERLDYPSLKHRVINFAERDKPSAILIEDKSSGQSLIQELRRDTSLPIIGIEPKGDKLFRAVDVSAMVEAGLLYLPKVAPWLVDFEGEFFAFPLSTHKDQVDSVTQYLKWARDLDVRIDSVGAGLTREMAEHALRGARTDDTTGYGSVGRGESMEGFTHG